MSLTELRRKDLIGSGQVEFRETMDKHALDVVYEGIVIASLQWHPDKPKRVVFNADTPLIGVSLGLLEAIVAKSKEVKPSP